MVEGKFIALDASLFWGREEKHVSIDLISMISSVQSLSLEIHQKLEVNNTNKSRNNELAELINMP